MKLWGGRFRKPTAEALVQLGRSIDFDRRLVSEEIQVNQVYARALAVAGWLTDAERDTLEKGLVEVAARLASDPPPFLPSDEDIHTAVERLLKEVVGDVAAKLPMGRSRNDLAVTEFRLYLSTAIQALGEKVRNLQAALVERAEQSTDYLLPGYTHMRRGQPVVFAQYLLSYFWGLERDRSRLVHAQRRCLELPLGAGALAGNPLGVDREAMASELGFPSILENSIDAVSTRDFALEFLAAGAILGTGLSRMGEDLVLWSGDEFGFVEMDDAYATGSSIMPQKKNPDGLELIRGKCGRLLGNLMALLSTVKGLPTGYQRDLQEDKEPVFDTLDTLSAVLPVLSGTVASMKIHPKAMERALSSDLLATDLAEFLVEKGVPFREAHGVVGEILVHAAEEGKDPAELDLATLLRFSPSFDADVSRVWSYRASVEKRDSRGGVGSKVVAEQIERACQRLSSSSKPAG
jgi:argininosuccinate lyase